MSERQVIQRGQDLAIILLNTVTLVAVASALVLPGTPESATGTTLLGLVGAWAGYRLCTRSRALPFQLADFSYVLIVAAAIPLFDPRPESLNINSVPQAIAGTAVIAVAVAHPPRVSFVASALITMSYAAGCAQLVGWHGAAQVLMLFYMLGIQWPIVAALRATGLAIARQVDQARAENHDAALREAIAAAVRDHELEHLALVHDTAASTLYLVGEGADISPDRIAAQARRDLELLTGGPARTEPMPDTDIVAAIRHEVAHLPAQIQLSGLTSLVLGGRTARTVLAAVREALNNAERHAHASRIDIDIAPGMITVIDDGVGFDPDATTLGHGVAESIVARMRRIGGGATITSLPGTGTRVTLSWDQASRSATTNPNVDDMDQLTERVLVQFGLGIAIFGFVQLLVAVPYAAAHTGQPMIQCGLGVIAAVVLCAGVPRVLDRGPNLTIPALTLMAAVIVVQSLSLPAELLGGPAQWPLIAAGMGVLPFLVRWRIGPAVATMLAFWLGTVIVTFVRQPGVEMAFNLALYTAGIALVQMFALAFPELLRDATAAATEEIRQRWAIADRHRIAEALHDDYVRRTSKLIRGVFPLLQTLSTGSIDAETRQRARLESRRLRLYIFQSRTFSHPLVVELRPAVDAADRRGVIVTMNADNDLPQLDEDTRRQILTPLRNALAHTRERARIGLTVAGGELIASIICDTAADVPGQSSESGPRVEVTAIGDTVWISVHHRLSGSPASPAAPKHSIA
ncbi:ATP-binding protein [Mycolicibacterium sp. 120266]|uniref:sensor histidine kinase n=1 Tax=Mycolicibacterium sp. 120266 TaxID=3090601 RepID=UPI00299E17C6|nr:ATP-binding protein [Mycolicibacterium sp. 120266]MDX1875689.1 ATP-binding protein [Mycolicibacterium sp. 120266]